MGRIMLAVIVGALWLTDAFAQAPPNPVSAHFRAYRAAMEQGDLVGAEREAEAALVASQARDGDSGNTGPLALNLATVRLTLQRGEQAYDPAALAHAIATRGSNSLDPLMTALVLGRAELASDRLRQGRTRLRDAIAVARPRAELDGETYLAAIELGARVLADGDYDDAAEVFEIAIEKADAVGAGNAFAQAQSRIGRATARSLQAMTATIREQARPTDTRLTFDADGALADADGLFVEAQALLAPAAYSGREAEPTLGQTMYGSTLAWRTLLRAFSTSRGLRSMAVLDPSGGHGSEGGVPLCDLAIVGDTRLQFPPGAISTFSVGAAVVRVRLDDEGTQIGSEVVAAVPDRWFREAVEDSAGSWRLARAADAPAQCRMPAVAFVPAQFYFR